MSESLANLQRSNDFEQINATETTKSLSSGAFPTVTSLTISAGVWLLVGSVKFANTGSEMNVAIMITDTSSDSTIKVESCIACRSSTGSTALQKTRIYTATTDTTIYLKAFQNSPNSINGTGILTAIKLA